MDGVGPETLTNNHVQLYSVQICCNHSHRFSPAEQSLDLWAIKFDGETYARLHELGAMNLLD
jgi:hypothetical protein